MEAHSEFDSTGHIDDVERYEQLRRRALAGDTAGWRFGLGVLQHRGVVAWLTAWRQTPVAGSAPATARPVPSRVLPSGVADQLVGVLAAMARGALANG